jgi:hypothetical protein
MYSMPFMDHAFIHNKMQDAHQRLSLGFANAPFRIHGKMRMPLFLVVKEFSEYLRGVVANTVYITVCRLVLSSASSTCRAR